MDEHISSLKQSKPLDTDTLGYKFLQKLLQATQNTYILLQKDHMKLEQDLREESSKNQELKAELREIVQEKLKESN